MVVLGGDTGSCSTRSVAGIAIKKLRSVMETRLTNIR